MRFVFSHPCKFCSSEITGRIEQMTETPFSAKIYESTLSIWHGTRVTPYYGRAQGLVVLVDTYQTMHLIRDTNGCYFRRP